ncbi:MAG TPA: PKD domain-containing protein [Thermoplasmata archaeon]|nr:PKD domain-containing protein [Thermoplasmata archaeon]
MAAGGVRRRRPWSLPSCVAVAALVVLCLPGVRAVPGTTETGGHATGGRLSTAHAASSIHGPPFSVAHTAASLLAPACRRLAAEANRSSAYGLPAFPIRAAEQGSCPTGRDTSILGFVSPGPPSGERFRVNLTLPLGTDAGRALADEFVGGYVRGVPCSWNAMAYLEVALVPPYSSLAAAPTGNWSVETPLFAAVPAGSCDPACNNDTATTTIGGVAYCDEDVGALPVMRAPVTPGGGFAPGDRLVVDWVGTAAGSAGLVLYVNDTSRPLRSLTVTLGPAATFGGSPITPRFASSPATPALWGYGADVGVGWTSCPALSGPTGCNSYDGAVLGAAGSVVVPSVHYWNSTAAAYSNDYSAVVTASSSVGCTANIGAAATCPDVSSFGGDGSTYPTWSLVADGRASAWRAGPPGPTTVDNFGGRGQAFGGNGTHLPVAPVGLAPPIVTSRAAAFVNVSVVAGAPDGVGAARLSVFGCVGSPTPSVSVVSASLGPGPGNSSSLGTWTASLATSGYRGTYPFWVEAESAIGGWSAPRWGNATVGGGGTLCTFTAPAAPGFTARNVSAVGGGYRLNWSESSPGVTGYLLYVNQSGGGVHDLYSTGNATAFVVDPGIGGAAFNVSIAATSAAGLTSATTPVVVGPSTLSQLTLSLGASPGRLVAPTNASTVTATIAGGAPPYALALSFGDGTNLSATTSSALFSVRHAFPTGAGNLRLSGSVSDAKGDAAVAPPVALPLVATPFGVSAQMAGADGFVALNWTTPAIAGFGVTHFTVFYAEGANASDDVSRGWWGNGSAPDAPHVWNTTRYAVSLPASDGTPVIARVVAFDRWGVGSLANGTQALAAVPATLLLQPIGGTAGGPAPFTDLFSTVATTGTNNSISSAIYAFPGGAFLPAQVTGGNGTFFLNVSYIFGRTGTQVVFLHVVDLFNDVATETTDIFVAIGAGPNVAVLFSAGFGAAVFPHQNVTFVPTVTGGSGNYSYAWQFGDGGQSNQTMPHHAYAAAGNYTALLTVLDNDTRGTTTWTGSVAILAVPTVGIGVSAGPNGSLSYRFQAIYHGGSGVTTFSWAFSDGTAPAGPNVTHDFPAPGRYAVNLTAVDVPSGRSANASIVLAVAGGNAPTGSTRAPNDAYLVYALIGLGIAAAAGFIAWAAERSRRRNPPPRPPEPTGYRISGGTRRPALPEPEGKPAPEPVGPDADFAP